MHTRASLIDDLRALRLSPAVTVMVHSSMKSIGAVDGGADAVLDALTEYLKDGILALPTLTWTLAREPAPRVFDPAITPSCVGLLPEMFRKRPGVVRSVHPTHSVAAAGRGAASFCAGNERCDSPCARTSPWGKLLDRGGTILMVGCGLTSCTFLHGVEEWTYPGFHLTEPIDYLLRMPDGTLAPTRSRAHSCAPSRFFGRAEADLRAHGAIEEGRFGDATVLKIDARRAYEAVSALLMRDPGVFEPEGAQ